MCCASWASPCGSPGDGRQALAALDDADFDIVLMDCHMPEMAGFEATAQLRRREADQRPGARRAGQGRRTPVIAMTTGVLREDRDRCLAAGMDDFVAKPIKVEVLERTMARYLTAGGAPPPSVPRQSTAQREVPAAAAGAPQDGLDVTRLELLRQLDPDGTSGLLSVIVTAFLDDAPIRLDALRAAVAAGGGPPLTQPPTSSRLSRQPGSDPRGHSVRGAGSPRSVRHPAPTRAPRPTADRAGRGRPRTGRRPTGARVKILVADDDLGSRLVAQSAVRRLGHECVTAEDGDAAWRLMAESRPDVLLTDRDMSGLDGLTLCRRLREQGQDGYTYVILLTGLGDPDEVTAGMQAGADDYLTKPLNPFDLQTRLFAASRVTQLHADLGRAQAALARQAHTDPLTGLRNRLGLSADLEQMHSVSERYGRSYCVAMCDVDHFKTYNDLRPPRRRPRPRTITATLTDQIRKGDRVYRYGGEEFLILLPEQNLAEGGAALARVRAALQSLAIEHRGAGPAVC